MKPKTPVVSSLNFSRISDTEVSRSNTKRAVVSKESIISEQSSSVTHASSNMMQKSEELELGLFGEVVTNTVGERIERNDDGGLFGEPGQAIISSSDALSPRSLRNSRRTRKKHRRGKR